MCVLETLGWLAFVSVITLILVVLARTNDGDDWEGDDDAADRCGCAERSDEL